jgi:hypothetical protein
MRCLGKLKTGLPPDNMLAPEVLWYDVRLCHEVRYVFSDFRVVDKG